jgi:DNA-binding HxlR family transcriptional regulator
MQIAQEQARRLEPALRVFHRDDKVATLLALRNTPQTVSELELFMGVPDRIKKPATHEYLTGSLIPAGYAQKTDTKGVKGSPSTYFLSPSIPQAVIPWAIYHTAFVTSRDIAMSDVLGAANSGSGESGVGRRISLLVALSEGPKKRRDLEAAAGTSNIDAHLSTLRKQGMILYDSVQTEPGKLVYSWVPSAKLELVKPVNGLITTTNKIAEIIHSSNGEGVGIQYVLGGLEKPDNQQSRSLVTRTIAGLVKQGLVNPETFSATLGYSKATLLPKGEDFVKAYAFPFMSTFLDGNLEFTQTDEYRALTSDGRELKNRLDKMLSKSRMSSGYANQRDPNVLAKEIDRILLATGPQGLKTTELLKAARLPPGSSTRYLKPLLKTGSVFRVKDRKGFRWSHFTFPQTI